MAFEEKKSDTHPLITLHTQSPNNTILRTERDNKRDLHNCDPSKSFRISQRRATTHEDYREYRRDPADEER